MHHVQVGYQQFYIDKRYVNLKACGKEKRFLDILFGTCFRLFPNCVILCVISIFQRLL